MKYTQVVRLLLDCATLEEMKITSCSNLLQTSGGNPSGVRFSEGLHFDQRRNNVMTNAFDQRRSETFYPPLSSSSSHSVLGVSTLGNTQSEAVCSVCRKVFVGRYCRSNLMVHMRIHTGETPFACSVCPYRAKRKHHLQLHIQARHKEQLGYERPLYQ